VPLVTIGIPTFERPSELARAVSSALAQDHRELEVLVSDDASAHPAVSQVAERLQAADARVRFVRQPRNLGHAGNYQWVLEAARGQYFMWLSDDDWLDPQYVSRCLAVLVDDPGLILVCGQARYYRNDAYVLNERPINLTSARSGARIVRYFARVSLNGPLFGLARRDDLLRAGFPQVVGGDWLLVASLAALGRVRTVPEVHIHRSLGGLGADASHLARSFGLRGVAARQHHVLVAWRMFQEIVRGRRTFSRMSVFERGLVGLVVPALIVVRFTLADVVRTALGPRTAGGLEARISDWLRQRETG
jgi:glycosyltransferase involved in cell wall biosynthesis